MKKNQIALTPEERQELEKFSKTGVHSVRLVTRSKIILDLDVSKSGKSVKQEEIAQRLGVSRQAVNDARRDFQAAENVSAFLKRKKRETPPVASKVTGELEARIITLACGAVPQGHAKWTLRLLASKCVELHYTDKLSHMTVKRLLKKHNLSLT
jgi:phytoene/squalene synthetase